MSALSRGAWITLGIAFLALCLVIAVARGADAQPSMSEARGEPTSEVSGECSGKDCPTPQPTPTTCNIINGTMSPDVLVGTNRCDVIRGFRGSDLILGAGGNDFILGGRHIDRIDGGPGFDTCYGGRETRRERRAHREDVMTNCEQVFFG